MDLKKTINTAVGAIKRIRKSKKLNRMPLPIDNSSAMVERDILQPTKIAINAPPKGNKIFEAR